MALRDAPGPNHHPLEFPTGIDGVICQGMPFVEYSGGYLTEMFRTTWFGVFQEGESVDHLYTVYAPEGGIRAEWYYHEHTLDRYVLLLGGLDLGLYDAREDSPTFGKFLVVSLQSHDEGSANAIRIPPGVWHSLKWTTETGMFLNSKLPPYRPGLPDKFRVSLSDLPEVITWNVHPDEA
jgi:dTDP-4-dehydrorhamnose 3,5-epimerase